MGMHKILTSVVSYGGFLIKTIGIKTIIFIFIQEKLPINLAVLSDTKYMPDATGKFLPFPDVHHNCMVPIPDSYLSSHSSVSILTIYCFSVHPSISL